MFLGFVVWWGMEERRTFGRIIGWGCPLSRAFSRLYKLSSLKNHFVFDFLVWIGSSYSFSFGFHLPLTDRDTMEAMPLLSVLENHHFCLGRRDLIVWNP